MQHYLRLSRGDFYVAKQHSNEVLPFGTSVSGNCASPCLYGRCNARWSIGCRICARDMRKESLASIRRRSWSWTNTRRKRTRFLTATLLWVKHYYKTRFLHRNVATPFRCGGFCNDHFIASFLLSVAVKEF